MGKAKLAAGRKDTQPPMCRKRPALAQGGRERGKEWG